MFLNYSTLQKKGVLRGFLAVVLVISFLVSCESRNKSQSISVEKEVVQKSIDAGTALYSDLEGNPVRLSDYKGKRILLHFWATWCKPCVEEMPALERARPVLEKENYQLLLVSEQSSEEILKFQERFEFEFPFLRYEGALSELKIYALPATYIFNEKGEKVMEKSGRMDWDSEPTIKQLINLP